MTALSSPRARKRGAERVVRVLAVHDGDAERARRVIGLVVDEVAAVLGPERFAAAVDVQTMDIAEVADVKVRRARCRAAELILGLDAEHLRRLSPPLLARHRVLTLEEYTLTLESVASTAAARQVVSLFERGHAAFARSVISAAFAARGLLRVSTVRPRARAADVEEYAPRLARAVGELAIGRHLAE